MADGESASAKLDVSEHLDSAIIMLVLIALFVYAFGAVGRYVGNRAGWSGVTGFFGG